MGATAIAISKAKRTTGKDPARPNRATAMAMAERGLYLAGHAEIDRAWGRARALRSFLEMLQKVCDERDDQELSGLADHLLPEAEELASWIGSLDDTVVMERRLNQANNPREVENYKEVR